MKDNQNTRQFGAFRNFLTNICSKTFFVGLLDLRLWTRFLPLTGYIHVRMLQVTIQNSYKYDGFNQFHLGAIYVQQNYGCDFSQVQTQTLKKVTVARTCKDDINIWKGSVWLLVLLNRISPVTILDPVASQVQIQLLLVQPLQKIRNFFCSRRLQIKNTVV